MSGTPTTIGFEPRHTDRRARLSLLLAVSLTCLVTCQTAQAQDIQFEIERILATPQSRDGQHLERLVGLGPAAVPILVTKLNTHMHPMVIIQALGRIGDERATLPLLNLLNAMEPFSPTPGEFHARRISAIAALREIGDWRAESLLRLIFFDEEVHRGTRLAAATALARFASPRLKGQARSFILQAGQESRPDNYGSLHPFLSFSAKELDQGLFELGTEESQALLADRLLSCGLADEEMFVLGLLKKSSHPSTTAALLQFSESPGKEAYVQLRAVKVLLDIEAGVPRNRLLKTLLRIRRRMPTEFYGEVDNLIEQAHGL